jgi:hypothetical protein
MPSPAAARSRRYRQRKRFGRAVIGVDVNEFALIDALIESGLLDEAEAESRPAVAAALADVIRRWQKTVARDAVATADRGMPDGTETRETHMSSVSKAQPPVSELVAAIKKPRALVEAEERLAQARKQHAALLEDIRRLSRENSAKPGQPILERDLRQLHDQREQVEEVIRLARRARAEAAKPYQRAVAAALTPISAATGQQLHNSVIGLKQSLERAAELAATGVINGLEVPIGVRLDELESFACRLQQCPTA